VETSNARVGFAIARLENDRLFGSVRDATSPERALNGKSPLLFAHTESRENASRQPSVQRRVRFRLPRPSRADSDGSFQGDREAARIGTQTRSRFRTAKAKGAVDPQRNPRVGNRRSASQTGARTGAARSSARRASLALSRRELASQFPRASPALSPPPHRRRPSPPRTGSVASIRARVRCSACCSVVARRRRSARLCVASARRARPLWRSASRRTTQPRATRSDKTWTCARCAPAPPSPMYPSPPPSPPPSRPPRRDRANPRSPIDRHPVRRARGLFVDSRRFARPDREPPPPPPPPPACRAAWCAPTPPPRSLAARTSS